MKQLQTYLDKIENEEAIDLAKFKTLIDKSSLKTKELVHEIQARRVAAQRYHVRVIPESLLLDLHALAQASGTDRISAAQQNRSHHHRVSGSFMVARKRDQHPDVILFDAEGKWTGWSEQSEQALLLENRQNFLDIEATLEFLHECTEMDVPETLDVIFCDGNAGSNRLHQKFFSSYQKLWLFLDLDLGGLKIARNIDQLVKKVEKTFILPFDIEDRLANVVEVCESDYLNKIRHLATESSLISTPTKLILKTYRKLEQEAHLYGYESD